MIELPEALTIAGQINDILPGKRVAAVTAAHTPHKLAWYYGDKAAYAALLAGRTVGKASALGGMVEIEAGGAKILFGEGAAIRFHGPGEPVPSKHQLLVEFADRSALTAAVQMYGGMGAFLEGGLDNPYYRAAREKPSPFAPEFDWAYFDRIASAPEALKLSLKGVLATGQRIPGLGNGVLQDILFRAGMHPKKKALTLDARKRRILFDSVKKTLSEMAARGGRDTELDLFGRPGGYKTILSKKTENTPCPVCRGLIKKESYMGGSIYYCEGCQEL